MKITEKRLRAIIRSVIKESIDPLDVPDPDTGMTPAEVARQRSDSPPPGYRRVDPLNRIDPDTGESVAQRSQRIADELAKEGKYGLASDLKKLAQDILDIFK